MTTTHQTSDSGTADTPRSLSLPFDEADLLAVRLLPAEFARAIGTTRQSVSRWIKDGKITLGADGRLNPTKAMRQLLRTGDPGRIRARLVKQAFADMADIRAQAARAADLELQLAAAAERLGMAEFAADLDYSRMDHWLTAFAEKISETAAAVRCAAADDWRAYVRETLERVMADGDDLESLAGASFAAPANLAKGEEHGA